MCHVAGDRQDVELIIDGNAVFARRKRQNEPTKEQKGHQVFVPQSKHAPREPEKRLPLIEPSNHILMSLRPVSRVHVLEKDESVVVRLLIEYGKCGQNSLKAYHGHSVQLLERVHRPQQNDHDTTSFNGLNRSC